jgi:hypothetical protein
MLRKHAIRTKVLVAAVVAAITVSMVISYEVLSVPRDQIPRGNIPSINFTSFLGYYNITYPTEFNESGNGFKVTFELRTGGPAIIYPSMGDHVYFGITYLTKSYSSPYTGVAFYVSHASLSIGNYTMTAFKVSYVASRSGTEMWLQFTVQESILGYDSAGHNYGYSFCISVLPVMFSGLFHTNRNAIVMEVGTGLPWYHVE